MFLLITPVGKYWRLAYRRGGKQKTMALGVYPAVPLAAARRRRDDARALLASGIDPMAQKHAAKIEKQRAERNLFSAVAEELFAKDYKVMKPKTIQKHRGWLDNDILPLIGDIPMAELRPRDVLEVSRRVEVRGSIESAHRVLQFCGRIGEEDMIDIHAHVVLNLTTFFKQVEARLQAAPTIRVA